MPTRIIGIALLSFVLCFPPARAEMEWHETKGNHFLVYRQSKSAFAEKVLNQAESDYRDTIRYFGSLSEEGFWLWDRRVKIFLYESQSEYLAITAQPEWSSGFADVRSRAIVSYVNAPEFLDSVLPHEMAHLVFREFIEVGNRRVPRWLDEGFAIAQEKRMRIALDETIKRSVRSGTTLPIADLADSGSLAARSPEQAKLFYAEAQSLTRFLMEKRDGSYFINFCRSLRDGLSLEQALRKNYREFASLSELETHWKRSVLES